MSVAIPSEDIVKDEGTQLDMHVDPAMPNLVPEVGPSEGPVSPFRLPFRLPDGRSILGLPRVW